MELSSILSVAVSTIGELENVVKIDWLGNVIKTLIESFGSIGVGIIVFTLILKLITLPFDIYSRVSTKKNAVKMEQMRPELEKLQRTYARNQDLYNQKMQELYKKNGYSPFSACLPTLLNLVVFMIVIGQFSTYSNYANFGVFCDMSVAYEQAVYAYDDVNQTDYLFIDTENLLGNGTNALYVKLDYFYSNHKEDENYGLKDYNFTIQSNNGYDATFTMDLTSENIGKLASEIEKGANGAFANDWIFGDEGQIKQDSETGEYSFILENCGVNAEGNAYTEQEIMQVMCTNLVSYYANNFANAVIKESGRVAAAEEYRSHDLRFLWVKNIWSQDLPWEHPVKQTFAEYNFVTESGCGASCSAMCNKVDYTINSVTEEQYKELTANLAEEKSQANGYLILVVLSIGTMLLSQIIMQKQNKTQMELSSVDGENGTAAQSQKMMTWMMPIMFGFFSFMYTASFSVYIVVSSLFSLAANLIINKAVEKKFEKLLKHEAYKMELKRMGKIKELKEIEEKENKKKRK